MPKYRLTLEVEVDCPVAIDKSELTITLDEIMESLINKPLCGGYAVCVKGHPKKLTASMYILKAELSYRGRHIPYMLTDEIEQSIYSKELDQSKQISEAHKDPSLLTL